MTVLWPPQESWKWAEVARRGSGGRGEATWRECVGGTVTDGLKQRQERRRVGQNTGQDKPEESPERGGHTDKRRDHQMSAMEHNWGARAAARHRPTETAGREKARESTAVVVCVQRDGTQWGRRLPLLQVKAPQPDAGNSSIAWLCERRVSRISPSVRWWTLGAGVTKRKQCLIMV